MTPADIRTKANCYDDRMHALLRALADVAEATELQNAIWHSSKVTAALRNLEAIKP